MGKLLFGLLIACCFVACDDAIIAGDMHSFQNDTWDVEERVVFELTALDSLKQYDVFVNVRNTNEYPFSNLFLIVSLEYPNGKTMVDTLEYKMAAPDGSWLGTGIGSVKESKLYYQENYKFTEKGVYALNITHAVRNNGDVQGVKSLLGITDVGYSLEEIKSE